MTGAGGSRPRIARPAAAIALPCATIVLAGCGGAQSTLDPHSRASSDIATLWWGMLAAAAVVLAGTIVVLGIGWLRRHKSGIPLIGESERVNVALVIAFGFVVPALTLAALFPLANIIVAKDTGAPAPGSTKMTIEVVGHQWFWEVRYPGTRAVTANEIHIPERTRVDVVVRTADVIHSFWVPQLNRKIDLIPGHANRVLLYADEPGRYRGQCTEFCGAQHAHMGLYVFAQTPARFRAWLANMARPARAPATAQQRRGADVFQSSSCASCHTIRGTAAQGTVGPDLTHLATRTTLAALTLPNTRAALTDWVRDPQRYKPANKMPAVAMSTADRRALVDYLESLR